MKRRSLGYLALALIAVLVVWDFQSPQEEIAECGDTFADYFRCPASYAALHTVVAGMIQTLLVLIAAWAFYDYRREQRERLLADSTVSIGLAGSVLPLLTVASVMAWLATPEPTTEHSSSQPTASQPTARRSFLAAKSNALGRGPLKWVRPLIRDYAWPSSSQLKLDASLLGPREADFVDEAIRQLVGTVRDWAGMYGASDLGRQAAHLVQSLRTQAQELERQVRLYQPTTTGPTELDTLRLDVLDWALVLQVAFEDASRPVQRRPEVVAAITLVGYLEDDSKLAEYCRRTDDLDGAARAQKAREWLQQQSAELTRWSSGR